MSYAPAQSHRPIHGCLVDLWHEDYDILPVGNLNKLLTLGCRHTAHMPREFDYRNLHPKINPQIWLLVFPRPFRRRDHAFCSAMTKSAGYENAAGGADFVPCFVEFGGMTAEGGVLEMLAIDPDDVEAPFAAHG